MAEHNNINYMNICNFVELGYLQEVNRGFLHPLGLALEATEFVDGCCELSGVWDYRGDAEGMLYGHTPDAFKASRVDAERERHRVAREKLLGPGCIVQPLGWRNV